VATFAVATETTATGVRQAVAVVETTDQRAATLSNAVKYLDGREWDIGPLPEKDRLISNDTRERTILLLEALTAYATILNDLADGSEAQSIRASFNDLADQLRNAKTKVFAGERFVPLAQAISVIAEFIARQQIAEGVAEVARQLHPDIEIVSRGLQAEINVLEEAQKDLWHNIERSHKNILVDVQNDRRVDTLGRLNAYLDASSEVKSNQLPSALAEARHALDKMVIAHAALQKPETPNALAQARTFLEVAESIKPLLVSPATS
jgi:hypothetical protein